MRKDRVRAKRTERGASTVGIALALGIVVVGLGIAVLMSTDTQVRLSFFDLKRVDSDWALRSSIKLVEEAWKRYIGIERVNATTFRGTVYEDVERYSRDQGLIDAITLAANNNDPNYSLLVLLYETLNTSVNPNTTAMPRSLIYQVDLTRDRPGFTNFRPNLDASDGIVFVAQQNNDGSITVINSVDNPDNDNDYDIIWNNIDNNGNRQFNAIITVTADGAPHYSSDNVFFVFPVKFELALTVRVQGGRDTVQKTVRGLGSCSFYVYRRSFAEYLIFSDIFTTESRGSIIIPRGFTYSGPVHTNTRFSFTGDPQGAIFNDWVSQVNKTAIFNGKEEPVEGSEERLSYNNCAPTFNKGFSKGVAAITPPTTADLGDIPGTVQAGAAAPTATGVYLRTTGKTWNTGDTLERGGIYIKGDVASLTLSQGERQQTYTITQHIRGTPSTTTTYYNTSDCTGTEYTTETSARRSKKVVQVTPVTGYVYTITSNYDTKRTTWRKDAIQQYTETVIIKYNRSSSFSPWIQYSWTNSNNPDPPVLVFVESKTYQGLIDVVKAENGQVETPQVAIYIDGALGENAVAGTTNTPAGLSGVLDKETELTICARGSVVIAGNTIYERSDANGEDPNDPTSPRLDKQGILGIISVTSKVYIDFPNPVGNPVYIDASIMAVNNSSDVSKRGVLTACDYQYNLNNPYIHLYGGVIQKYYGAVGQSGTPVMGYSRNFQYDPRLRTSPPPLYPRQSACRMQLENNTGDNTLQLAWNY